MKVNEGTLDRTIRVILGLVLLSLLFFIHGSAKYWGLIGIIPLVTAFIGWCPLYSIFGIKTCKR